MDTWSPASWQLIRRRVQELTGIKPTFERIEAFIDSEYLWEESPESIAALIVEDILK